MTSEPREAFVWIYLPGAADPVVAGRLDVVGDLVAFTYGRSYLARAERIPVYLPELPLRRGQIMPLAGEVAGCIADAGPDAWGRRVVLNRLTGGDAADTGDLPPPARHLDRWCPVVKSEFVAMELARRAGTHVAAVELTEALGKDVLLVGRFDRPATGGRRALVSALTILGLGEWGGRYASYEALADEIRERFTAPKATLRELFSRLTINVLLGNTDDHARNHSALWDGAALILTPAYDICALPRAGGEASQAMAIGRDGFRLSQVAGCVARASTYLLTEDEAREIVDGQVETIEREWSVGGH